ncbi:MAG: hypothetical protein LBU77_06850 [Clostridiales bacterium]|nr:hypothetical protein [Clostridiales bacterium]
MLTSIYYYNYYKPYLVKGSGRSEKTASFVAAPARARTETVYDGKHAYILNTARKSTVVDYIRGLSSNITGLKESAKNLADSVTRYQNASHKHMETDSEKDWLANSLKEFAEDYTAAYAFSKEHPHSAALSQFAGRIENELAAAESLSERKDSAAFLKRDQNGGLTFDAERFNQTGADDILKELRWINPAATEIKNATIDFLAEPLSEHMAFRDLEYYYNYQYGTEAASAFRLVDSGLLLDLVI